MATFQLKQGADTFDLDTAGSVQNGGAAFGTWSTNTTNQVVITPSAGAAIPIDVTWSFNNDNHLVLKSGAQSFDFSSTSARPFFKTTNAVLQVFPDNTQAFNFSLNGTWDIDANHNLSFTVTGVTSSIQGFVQDPKGRFMYHFFDKQDLTRESILGFVGAWHSFTSADGKPMIRFEYKRANNTDGTFTMPGSIAVNRTINEFMYEYDKDGQTRRLQFVGSLKISPNFQITYTLDRQVSQGQEQVASTTFTFGATFQRNDFTGDIQLAIKKNDGTPGTTITVAGNFTAVLGTAQLSAGFSFSQIRNGATISTTIAFNGSLKFKNNGEITWEFAQNASQMSINLNAQVQVGPARVDGRLNLTSDNGKVVGVKVLLGIAF
jgi:hypothetical protein